MMMNRWRGGGWPELVRLLLADRSLDHVALRQQRDELLRRLRRGREGVEDARRQDDEDMQEPDEENPLPEAALFLENNFSFRFGRGTPLQIEAHRLPRFRRGRPARLGVTGGGLHDLLVLYIVVSLERPALVRFYTF